MTIGQAIEQLKASQGRERVLLASGVADTLRFRGGLNYSQTVELVERHGISAADWEELMYMADTIDSM